MINDSLACLSTNGVNFHNIVSFCFDHFCLNKIFGDKNNIWTVDTVLLHFIRNCVVIFQQGFNNILYSYKVHV